jgi:predicted ATPase
VANLTRALKSKQLLLVFDNCEHLVEPVARLIAAVLHDSPHVRILASSRQGLGLTGEVTYRMPSLAVPPADGISTSAAAAMSYVAVALFVERARALDNSFALTDENAPIVADICRRLDGIPLAIELAAVRVRFLGPRQLRDRLNERFRVLTGGSRDALPRQQTLRALIDWSHDLLDERERVLFARLGIFVSGFTLDGAVAVGSCDDVDEFDVVDILASLVDKSLVLVEAHGDVLRYRLLESTRAYALEKLSISSDADVIAGRHLHYFRDTFGQLQADAERTRHTAAWVDAFTTELDDLRAALDAALERADLIAGAELLAALDRIWIIFALDREGAARNESFGAKLPQTQTLLRARLLAIHASLLFAAGSFAAAADVGANAVTVARQSDDNQTLATGLVWLAFASIFLDDITAAKIALDEADALPGISARLQKLRIEARAQLYTRTGDLAGALAILVEMRRQYRALGNRRDEALTATSIAEIEHQRGQTPAAIAILRETLPELRGLADTFLLSAAYANLSGYLVAIDDLPAAIEAAREAIAGVAPYEPDYNYVIYAIEHVALVCARCNDVRPAAILLGYSDAALARVGAARDFNAQGTHDRLATILGEKLTADARARLTAEGAALTPEAAIAIAQGVTVREAG